MTERLTGNVAVVTGGTAGIGRCIAERFVQEGACVVIAGRSVDRAEEIARALGAAARFVRADVEHEDQIQELIARTLSESERLVVLVNNWPRDFRFEERGIESDVFDAAVRLLLRSVFYGIKHATPAMAPNQSGSIISISSVAVFLAGARLRISMPPLRRR